jgi:ADP-ribosyl-[dinitrogen reductase] hydrolase
MHPNSPSTEDRLQGLLLGAAMGDALGLPSEGLTRGRIARLWPGPLRHRFIAGRGMGSDDTEHLVFTTLSLLRARGDVELFQTTLAGHLKRWLLLFPAGVGLATARSIIKLWMGWKPGKNGVFSAGNGPGMRSSIIGAFFARDPALMQQFVAASTRLTHTDPKALTGAHSLAQAAAWILSGNEHAADLFKSWSSLSSDAEWLHAVKLMQSSLIANRSVSDLAIELGSAQRVSGYIYRSVPVALYAWLRHRGDFTATLTEVVHCGGDTDTTGAMAGALAGLDVGIGGIPSGWIQGWCDWPVTRSYLLDLGRIMARAPETVPPGSRPSFPSWIQVLPRNLGFLLVVLFHGFRRLFPPY